jgi:peptidoglycan/xylan/chitin deacetylase (PgdA/CDA1 family)
MKSEFIISLDDGRMPDLEAAKLLDRYNVKATFYIPGNCELNDDEIKLLSTKHEIGSHSVSHPELTHIGYTDVMNELIVSKDVLENITGKEVTKFCYPRGKYNENVKKLVKKAGYKEARTTHINCIEFPKDPFETKTSIHIYPKYGDKEPSEVAKKYIDLVKKNGGRFEA